MAPSASRVPRVAVLVAAAGRGRRAGGRGDKLLQTAGDAPLIVHTVQCFQAHPRVAQVRLIVRSGQREAMAGLFADADRWDKVGAPVEGGAERQDSVRNGLAALEAAPPDWVLVHDGARPLCPAAVIDGVLDALREHPVVVPALPIHDSVRRITAAGSAVIDREGLHAMQTPQGFRWDVLREAHRLAQRRGDRRTDDAQLAEALGIPVHFSAGAPRNVKVTTAAELELVRGMLEGGLGIARHRPGGAAKREG